MKTYYLYNGQLSEDSASSVEFCQPVHFMGNRYIMKTMKREDYEVVPPEDVYNLIISNDCEWILAETLKGNIIKKVFFDIEILKKLKAYDIKGNCLIGQIEAYVSQWKT